MYFTCAGLGAFLIATTFRPMAKPPAQMMALAA